VLCWSNLQTEPTHCLVPYAGSGIPFEKYGTDESGAGCTGSKCRPTEGAIKPRLEVKRGLERKYKNQYETQTGARSESAWLVNADGMNSECGRRGGGLEGKSCWTKLYFIRECKRQSQNGEDEKYTKYMLKIRCCTT
jgi:hypothetical protein